MSQRRIKRRRDTEASVPELAKLYERLDELAEQLPPEQRADLYERKRLGFRQLGSYTYPEEISLEGRLRVQIAEVEARIDYQRSTNNPAWNPTRIKRLQ